MNSYLLIGHESLIDHIGCIRDLGIAYWKKANKKMQIGDIIYLFISDVEHNRVMYRLQVVETDCVRDDKKYWRGTYKHDTSCFKLKNICGAQEYAKGFCESVGFKQSSDTFMLDGIPHIKMTWTKDDD